jgi:hypothetical protein
MTATWPSGGISATAVGVATALYLASASSNGAQEQVRVVVDCNDGSGSYFVVRVFPLIFFDGAKPY